MPAPELVGALAARFSGSAAPLGIEVPASSLVAAARALRDQHGYRYYVMASATERAATLELIHALRHVETLDTLFLRTPLPKDAPRADSLALVFSGAEWHEREVYDLFGIVFAGHPDPRRILLPDEYEGHPLRKSFAMDTPWGYRPAAPRPEEGAP